MFYIPKVEGCFAVMYTNISAKQLSTIVVCYITKIEGWSTHKGRLNVNLRLTLSSDYRRLANLDENSKSFAKKLLKIVFVLYCQKFLP
jgi:hypothetical protein